MSKLTLVRPDFIEKYIDIDYSSPEKSWFETMRR